MLFYANCIKIKNINFFLQIRLTFTKIWCRIDYSKLCGIKYLGKGFIFKMNMKKLLAGVVAATVLMSNVAFAANVATTTTYNGDGTVDVKTDVTGITTPNAMVTYVLYGEKTRVTMPFNEETGAVLGTEQSTPSETNIIYIDQDNNVTTTTSFTAPGLTVGQAYGAKVIVGSDSSTDVFEYENEYTGDMYTLKLADTTEYTAKVEVRMSENEDYVATYNLAGSASVKVPVNANCKVTFEATDANYEIATSAVTSTDNNITDGNVSENDGVIDFDPTKYATNTEYELSATTKAKVVAPIITVSNMIANLETDAVTFLVNVTTANPLETGLKVVYNNDYEFDNLIPAGHENGCYAIRLVDKADDFSFENETSKYKVTAFLMVDGEKVYSDTVDQNHFTFTEDPNLGNGAQDETSTPDPASNESTGEEPAAEEPATEEPVAEESATEEPAAEEPAVVNEPVVEETTEA